MVVLRNIDIQEQFNYLTTIDNILDKEVRQISGNKKYIDKIVPDYLKLKYSQKEILANTFSDNIRRTAYENSIVSLVATFEKVVFAKYRSTYGIIRNIVSVNTNKSVDFYKSRERFVNDKIDRLSGIINLFDGLISPSQLKNLKIIKDHRNYIAHGKRDVTPPLIEFKLFEVAEILDNIISEIESYPSY